ncbi:MAG: aminoacyl-tRNA deacylase [Deltaproteobacteria bacterium]|nr:aminoacyl-tRNA deacylase [Candidatus Anaeroferrophillacea bacterium]
MTRTPMTPALRFLRQAGVKFTIRGYAWEEHGGTAVAARELGVDEHRVIKTLVLETDAREPLLMLMHGDREVSLKELARTLDVRRVTPCSPADANRHTGCLVGGISPFGTRKRLPACMETTIGDLDCILINGGRRGLLLEIAVADLVRVLAPRPVSVAR